MNIYSDFQNPKIIEKLITKIQEYKGVPLNIMEVCGSHTDAIGKYGIRSVLPKNINLVSGPGCPVCVADTLFIDKSIELSQNKNVIICSFGDLIKVKGSEKKLTLGENLRVVLSPIECLEIAKENPHREIVFLSVGFETTTPITALSIYKAKKMGLQNISFFVSDKTMPNILRFLVNEINNSKEKCKIDAFLFPGNVSVIEGYEFYENFCQEYNLKGTITGFEPMDILASIVYILYGRENFNNLYSRFVKKEGNREAKSMVKEIFKECDTYLREIGLIHNAGLKIRDKYIDFDANIKFNLKYKPEFGKKTIGCLCGEIMLGQKKPSECPFFGKTCTPLNAIGPCMVSGEGSCAAYYKYK